MLNEEQRKENEHIFLQSLSADDSPTLQDIVTDMMDTFKTVAITEAGEIDRQRSP